jgi:predicted porin
MGIHFSNQENIAMNRSLLTLAVLGTFVGGALAQSSVTIYGKVDVGVTFQDDEIDNATSVGAKTVRVSSGVSGGSRIGFRGVEDLGGGMKARFQLETGLCTDGARASATPEDHTCGGDRQLFGRMAIVALEGGFGGVVLGRQFTSSYLHMDRVDPFGTGLAGAGTNMFPFQQRLNNVVAYHTPDLGGFSATVAYAAGEQPGDKDANRIFDGEVSYSAGPLYVGVAYDLQDDTAGTKVLEITNVGGTYDFGVVKGYLQYQTTESDGSVNAAPGTVGGVNTAARVDQETILIGVSVPIGRGNLMASYIDHSDDANIAGVLPMDSDQVAVGYMYALSKRTQLYTAIARINNDNGARKTVGDATEKGSGERAVNFGVVHNF